MFRHSYRGTLMWLFIVGMALVLTLLSGTVSTAVGAALLAAYLAMVVFIARDVDVTTVLQDMRSRPEKKPTQSEVARDASARARSRPHFDRLIRLLDIGLIVDEQRPDGMALRPGRFISLDDDALRPYAIVDIPAELAERLVHVRFEIHNETGALQYVYEDEKWLRSGENVLLPDYRLPIRKNAADLAPGSWGLHVIVDGGLLGVHHFNVSPSLAMRRRDLDADGEIRERVWRSEAGDESLPLSLEELLRQQSRERSQH